MAERKYETYIVMEPKPNHQVEVFGPPPKLFEVTPVAYLDDEVVKGSFYAEGDWFIRAAGEISLYPHVHDFDEVLGFFGCDPKNPHDLHGEIEFWLEEERYVLTRSCILYIPRGLRHGPLIFKRVDSPIFHFGTAPTGVYHGQKVEQ